MGAAGMRWARQVGGLTVGSELVNPGLAGGGPNAQRTPSFTWSPSRRLLTHRLAATQIDNDLGDRIAAELVRPGLTDDFEAAFAGVVTSTDADPLSAWERFYAQTLERLTAPAPRAGDHDPGGAIVTFAAIYRHALGLLAGDSLLDAGSCFGFFCLLAARRTVSVTGTDVSAPTVALAAQVARRLAGAVDFAVADVCAGLPGRADTVTALHVLEHLAPERFAVALECLCAAARRRVIVAVPLESAPDPTYGHRTAFADLDALRAAAGERDGWRAEVHAHRGGWVVLDRTG